MEGLLCDFVHEEAAIPGGRPGGWVMSKLDTLGELIGRDDEGAEDLENPHLLDDVANSSSGSPFSRGRLTLGGTGTTLRRRPVWL